MLRFLLITVCLDAAQAFRYAVYTCQFGPDKNTTVSECDYYATLRSDLSNATLETALQSAGYEAHVCRTDVLTSVDLCIKSMPYSAPLSPHSVSALPKVFPQLIANTLTNIGNLSLPTFGCEPNCTSTEINFDNPALQLYHSLAILEFASECNITKTASNSSKVYYYKDRANVRRLSDACEGAVGCQRFLRNSESSFSWDDLVLSETIDSESSESDLFSFLQHSNTADNFSLCGCMPVLRQTYQAQEHQNNAQTILEIMFDLMRPMLAIRDRQNQSTFHIGDEQFTGVEQRLHSWVSDLLVQSANSTMAIQLYAAQLTAQGIPSYFNAYPQRVYGRQLLGSNGQRRLQTCDADTEGSFDCDPRRVFALQCFGVNGLAHQYITHNDNINITNQGVAQLDSRYHGAFCTYANSVYDKLPSTLSGSSKCYPTANFTQCFDADSFYASICFRIGIPFFSQSQPLCSDTSYTANTALHVGSTQEDSGQSSIFSPMFKSFTGDMGPELLYDMQTTTAPFYKQSSDITTKVDELSPLLKLFLILGLIVFGFYLLVLLGKAVEFGRRKLKMGAEIEGSRHEKVPVLGAATFTKRIN